MRKSEYTLNRNGNREKIARATYSPKSFRTGGSVDSQAPSGSLDSEGSSGSFKAIFIIGAVIAVLYGMLTYSGKEAGVPVPLPDNGTVWKYTTDAATTAPLRIITDKKLTMTHVLVLVSDWKTSVPVMAMFVMGGREAQTMLPIGSYRVSLATGSQWYGIEHLFGKNTAEVQGVKPIDLYQSGPHQSMGVVINLNEKIDGNYPLNPGGLATKKKVPVTLPWG